MMAQLSLGMQNAMAFLPEWVLLAGALAIFVCTVVREGESRAHLAARLTALALMAASALSLGSRAVMFDGAYRVDALSQALKLVLSIGLGFVLLLGGGLRDIRAKVRAEYLLLLLFSVLGLFLVVSSNELITLVVALELSAFPIYLMVPLRREIEGQRSQMESAIKYIMFGVAANGIMLFGLGYLFGLTGTTSLPLMAAKLGPLMTSPVAIAGLIMACAGLFYKLALVPFHFWTPDVYEGASNETASVVASLPKLAAMAVLFRFVSFSPADNRVLVGLLGLVAAASMAYGNLVALAQRDFKRLLGFSGIAHAGYALLGLVTLDPSGYTAGFYYLVGYLFMVLACFTVIQRVSRDGANLAISDLAGLHRRSPLLAATLVVGVFALAGIPPFAGFMGKLALFTAAVKGGHLGLVIFAVVNTAIAIYYYLGVIRETCFGEPKDSAPIPVDFWTRVLCLGLIAAIVVLGVAPARFLELLSGAVGGVLLPAGSSTAVL